MRFEHLLRARCLRLQRGRLSVLVALLNLERCQLVCAADPSMRDVFLARSHSFAAEENLT